ERVSKQSPQQIVRSVLELKSGSKLQILSPVIKNKKGEHKEELAKYQSLGFMRIRLNGEIITLDENVSITKTKFNDIDIVVDRLVLKEGNESRLTDSIEHALQLSNGYLIILADDKELFFSEHNFSFATNKSYPDLEPRLFSFNSPIGACPMCNGLGIFKQFDRSHLVLDANLSLEDGAIPL